LIIRRQPLHPGTQASLLPDLEYRFWGHYTDCDGDSIELDRQMPAHAHVERPHSTPERLWARTVPIHRIRSEPGVAPNRLLAADLVVWFQLLCLTGPLALARPKRLRWDLWHAPARII